MEVRVRDREYTDKNTKEKKTFKEVYITFEFYLDGKTDTIDIPLKIDNGLARSMIVANPERAEFDVREYKKDDKVYYFPVIEFNTGVQVVKIDVKMSQEAIVLARIGLDCTVE